MALPLINKAFQVAYVTNDLEAAARVFRDQYGAGEFLFMRDLPDSLTDIALAYAGDWMIELVQPLAASGDFYSDFLGQQEGLAIRHHHFGMLVDDTTGIAAIRARHIALNNPIVYEGYLAGAIEYLYADCRDTTGHFLEYIRLEEGGRQMFAAIPDSKFG